MTKPKSIKLEDIIREERKYYLSRRRHIGATVEANEKVDLALSGGGIRSACFCLGVVSSMLKNGCWSDIDYISSVSGGGYTAAALARHMGSGQPLDQEMIEATLEKMKEQGGFLAIDWSRLTTLVLTLLLSLLIPIAVSLILVGMLAVASFQHLWLPGCAFFGIAVSLWLLGKLIGKKRRNAVADFAVMYMYMSVLFLLAWAVGYCPPRYLLMVGYAFAACLLFASTVLCATPAKPHIRRRQRLFKRVIVVFALSSTLLFVLAEREYFGRLAHQLGVEGLFILCIVIFICSSLAVWVSPNILNGLVIIYRRSLRDTFRASTDGDERVLLHQTSHSKTAPIHIINCFAQFSRTGDTEDIPAEMLRRGGVNFAVSPLYSGSRATGYVDTHSWYTRSTWWTRPQDNFWSLVAASGGALDTHPTRMSPFMRMALAFLNIGLGLWVANPRAMAKSSVMWPSFTSNLRNLVEWNAPSDLWIRLSDGGHFENLGLYELVARECTRIIVVDAGYDPDFEYFDLAVAARRCAEDFKARIEIDIERGKPSIVTRGTIHYEGASQSTPAELVYIKLAALREHSLPLRLRGAYDAGFPHELTANQFVDDEFVQAYFALGRESGQVAFGIA